MTLARDTLSMIHRRGVAPERTGTDGYEQRIPQNAYDDLTDRVERQLYLERLRASIHRADHGVIQ